MLPSASSSAACAASTCNFNTAPVLTGYSTLVLSNSFLGHSHTGQLSVLHIVLTAISKPSILIMCQKQRPSRTFLSANRKYLSSEHSALISAMMESMQGVAMMESMQRWYKSRRRCLCHSTLVFVKADGFMMGSSPSGLQAYGRDITMQSLLRDPTAKIHYDL